MPDQSGRRAVVTGANSGIGFETARVLAGRGASVVLVCRNQMKAIRAAEEISDIYPHADLTVVDLDLASLESIRQGADEIRRTWPRIDLLVNNAGVMEVPFGRSPDGHELTWAINHLGHFALTGLLLGDMMEVEGSRIITVSSTAHRRGRADFTGATTVREHDAAAAYAESKLANLMFGFELDRRLRAFGARTCALAAHPGNVSTRLWRTSSLVERILVSGRLRPLNFWLAHRPAEGALPVLRAATDWHATGSQYYGPSGWHEATGAPALVEASPLARDKNACRRLWQQSERQTGVRFPLPAAPDS